MLYLFRKGCAQGWGWGGIGWGPHRVCACMCVCLCAKPLASLGAAVLGRVFGGLLVSLKALDNKDHFFFSWETKPSLPEAGSHPLHPSPTPHSPAPLSSPLLCLLQNVFFLHCFFSHLKLSSLSLSLQIIFSTVFSVFHSYFCVSISVK